MDSDLNSDAELYNSLNKPQYDLGCNFVRSMNLTEGEKVLDIGCGTGDVAAFISHIVGEKGEVIGIDPDQARINIAREKFKDVKNLKFFAGDSTTGFLHDSEEYYDVHFSNCVFHWLQHNQKMAYLEKASRCLKQGGRLAILTVVKQEIKFDPSFIERLTEQEYKALVEGTGWFSQVKTEMLRNVTQFASYEEFDAWLKASSHRNSEEMDQEWMKAFLKTYTRTESDGKFTMEINELVRITATKM